MPRFAERLNRIRAAVLGANDGVVSVSAGLVGIGAAGASTPLVAALALILAGASSMALGEYISVRAQVDTEREAGQPVTVSPYFAGLASALSFVSGAILPSAVAVFSPAAMRLQLTATAALAALGVCGLVAAKLSDAPASRPTLRAVVGGAIALAITYGGGRLAA